MGNERYFQCTTSPCSPQTPFFLAKGTPLHCVRTARYFLDQVPRMSSQATPSKHPYLPPASGARPTIDPGSSVGAGGGPSSTNGCGMMDPGVLGMAV